MYSETAKVGGEVKRSAGSQLLLEVLAPCEKGPETNKPMCFGTSELFFCGSMECPHRKACEKLVSPWNFD
jgi:hypothetical protein